jgi:predicted dithiol-disulfide oxidoreductase (DUF899 family)
MRARDVLAAERRRMPWMIVGKAYEFEGPKGKVSLLDLFEGRRQLIVYRAFFEPPSHRHQHRQAAGAAAKTVTGAVQFLMQMTMTPAPPPSSAHL